MKFDIYDITNPRKAIVAGAIGLSIGIVALPAVAAIEPLEGIYEQTEFTTAVSGGAAGDCDNWGPVDTQATPRSFTYPGPARAGAIERAPTNGPGADFIFVISYPTTPAKGVTSWLGTYKADFIPVGVSWSGSFAQSWTFVDASSYVFTGTLSGLPSIGGKFVCQITFQGTAIRTGK